MEELQAINNLLAKGITVTEAEKQLGYSEGKLRKQLSKIGYKFDRKLNQYILKDGIQKPTNQLVTCSNGVTKVQDNQKNMPLIQGFTSEQVSILQQIINEYIVRQQIQESTDIDKGKTINRNIRVYEKQFEVFTNWCRTNNVTQANALYKAINMLMNRVGGR